MDTNGGAQYQIGALLISSHTQIQDTFADILCETEHTKDYSKGINVNRKLVKYEKMAI